MNEDILQVTFTWKGEDVECPLCHVLIKKLEIGHHFYGNEHTKVVNKLLRLEHRLTWQRIAKHLYSASKKNDTIITTYIPSTKKYYKCKIINTQNKESSKPKKITDLRNEYDFETELSTALQISKAEFESIRITGKNHEIKNNEITFICIDD